MSPTPAPTTAPPSSSAKHAGLLVFFLVNILLFTSLGVWQVQRLAWKEALIEQINSRVHSAPQDVPAVASWPDLTRENAEYLPIQVQGHWVDQPAITVYANTELGAGYWVMAPFAVGTSASILWVNQGFIPTELRKTARPPATTGTTTVIGLLRFPEQENLFLRANVPAEDRWYRRWPNELSAARDLAIAQTAPYFLDAYVPVQNAAQAAQAEWPRAGMTQIQFRNNHLSYAITWFILALLNGAAFIYVMFVDRRGKHQPD